MRFRLLGFRRHLFQDQLKQFNSCQTLLHPMLIISVARLLLQSKEEGESQNRQKSYSSLPYLSLLGMLPRISRFSYIYRFSTKITSQTFANQNMSRAVAFHRQRFMVFSLKFFRIDHTLLLFRDRHPHYLDGTASSWSLEIHPHYLLHHYEQT